MRAFPIASRKHVPYQEFVIGSKADPAECPDGGRLLVGLGRTIGETRGGDSGLPDGLEEMLELRQVGLPELFQLVGEFRPGVGALFGWKFAGAFAGQETFIAAGHGWGPLIVRQKCSQSSVERMTESVGCAGRR